MLACPFDKAQTHAAKLLFKRGLPQSVGRGAGQCAEWIRRGDKRAAVNAKGTVKFGEIRIGVAYAQRRGGIAQDAIMGFIVSPERVRIDGRIELQSNLLAIKAPDISEFRPLLCALPNTRYQCDKGRCVSYLSLSVNVLTRGVHRAAQHLYDAFLAYKALAQAPLSRGIWIHLSWQTRT